MKKTFLLFYVDTIRRIQVVDMCQEDVSFQYGTFMTTSNPPYLYNTHWTVDEWMDQADVGEFTLISNENAYLVRSE